MLVIATRRGQQNRRASERRLYLLAAPAHWSPRTPSQLPGGTTHAGSGRPRIESTA